MMWKTRNARRERRAKVQIPDADSNRDAAISTFQKA
jgi:hypothetical protein